MEREEDNLQEKMTGVQPETPAGEWKEKEYPAQEKTIFSDREKANPWTGEKKISKGAEFVNYLRFIRPYFLIITLVFFGSLFAGYVSSASFPDLADTLMEGFSSRFGALMDMSPLFIMFAIFINNAFVSLLFMVLGLAFGVFPVLFVAFNGYLVGVVSHLVAGERGLLFVFLALLPHGMVELPMIFLASAIGLRLGHQVISAFTGRHTEIKKEFKEGLSFYFRWIMPLLFIAAVIETFITPIILSFL